MALARRNGNLQKISFLCPNQDVSVVFPLGESGVSGEPQVVRLFGCKQSHELTPGIEAVAVVEYRARTHYRLNIFTFEPTRQLNKLVAIIQLF